MNSMNVTSDIAASIEKLNHLLMVIAGSGAGLEEKLSKQAAMAGMPGLGDYVDTSV